MSSPEQPTTEDLLRQNREITAAHVGVALRYGQTVKVDAATAEIGGAGPPSGVASREDTRVDERVKAALSTGIEPDNPWNPSQAG